MALLFTHPALRGDLSKATDSTVFSYEMGSKVDLAADFGGLNDG